MEFVYTVAAFLVVPAILVVFHLLSRTPRPSPPHPVEAARGESRRPATIAEEAERWLRAQG